MITFKEHSSDKYPPRTYENASADATIAFAFDFNTPGERLTQTAVVEQGKDYIGVHPLDISDNKINLDACKILSIGHDLIINIAGNGLYTMVKYKYTQSMCDELVYNYLYRLINRPIPLSIALFRSGGQSGFDEAGIKAAVKLGIPALCLCPKGWKFKDANGVTISNEQKFKERFL